MATQQTRPPSDAHVMGNSGRAPLILTLELAQPGQGVLQALRNKLFPPERNVVPAHVSLFHALPGEALNVIRDRLGALEEPRMVVSVQPPAFTGRGVSLPLHAPDLVRLHDDLATGWTDWLTPQDRQRYRPHVTVQNKVPPEVARAAHEDLSRGFVPWQTEGVALLLWRYLGWESGRWEALGRFPLRDPEASPDDGRLDASPALSGSRRLQARSGSA